MEQISYKLEHFEGPLDLLLHLIEKNKVNIYDIPIAEIANQYLDYVKRWEQEDLNVVSDFLVMAATLLDIKAKMLLPREVDEEGEEIDPRAELVTRLLEYKAFKLMAQELSAREEGAERQFYKLSTLPPEVAKYQPPVDLDSLLDGLTLDRLQKIFQQVMRRQKEKVDPIRSHFGTIRREPISLKQKVGSVLRLIRSQRRLSFRQLLERREDRLELVVTFLAVLELMKVGKIYLKQELTFGEMEIQALEPEGTEDEPDFEAFEDLEDEESGKGMDEL